MDIRTILYINLFLLAGCTIALAVIALHSPRFREFRWLAIAYAAGWLSTFLRMWQGHIPDFFALVLSNVLLISALLLVHRCFAAFVKANTRISWVEIVLLLGIVAGLSYYTYLQPNFAARSLVVSLAFLGVAALSAYVLIRYSDAAVRIPCVATAALYIAFGLLTAVRCVGIVFGGAPQNFFSFSVAHLMGFLAFYVLIAGIPLGYFWMTSARLYAKQEHLARTDFLTGLPNRRAIEELAVREIERCRQMGMPLAMLAVDIDHFKRINDQHGHDVGDTALRAIAGALAEAMHPQDSLARLGGEEFAILMPDMNLQDAAFVAEQLRLIIEELPIATGFHTVKTTASFGIATLGQDDSFEDILRRADYALYAAKLAGRNRISVSPELV